MAEPISRKTLKKPSPKVSAAAFGVVDIQLTFMKTFFFALQTGHSSGASFSTV